MFFWCWCIQDSHKNMEYPASLGCIPAQQEDTYRMMYHLPGCQSRPLTNVDPCWSQSSTGILHMSLWIYFVICNKNVYIYIYKLLSYAIQSVYIDTYIYSMYGQNPCDILVLWTKGWIPKGWIPTITLQYCPVRIKQRSMGTAPRCDVENILNSEHWLHPYRFRLSTRTCYAHANERPKFGSCLPFSQPDNEAAKAMPAMEARQVVYVISFRKRKNTQLTQMHLSSCSMSALLMAKSQKWTCSCI